MSERYWRQTEVEAASIRIMEMAAGSPDLIGCWHAAVCHPDGTTVRALLEPELAGLSPAAAAQGLRLMVLAASVVPPESHDIRDGQRGLVDMGSGMVAWAGDERLVPLLMAGLAMRLGDGGVVPVLGGSSADGVYVYVPTIMGEGGDA